MSAAGRRGAEDKSAIMDTDEAVSVASGFEEEVRKLSSSLLSSRKHFAVHPEAEHFISLHCTRSRFHWGIFLRDVADEDYGPFIFWKTSPLNHSTDIPSSDHLLSKFFPPKVCELLGGQTLVQQRTARNLLRSASLRRIPYLEIYVTSDEPDLLEPLPSFFKHLPCRIIQIPVEEFILPPPSAVVTATDRDNNDQQKQQQQQKNAETGTPVATGDKTAPSSSGTTAAAAAAENDKKNLPSSSDSVPVTTSRKEYAMTVTDYEVLGVERVASIYAAYKEFGVNPTIIFDADAVLTYTCVDGQGRIIGGGMCPGMSTKCQSMYESLGITNDLDTTPHQLKTFVEKVTREGLACRAFNLTFEENMIIGVVRETAVMITSLVRLFIQKMAPNQVKGHPEFGSSANPITIQVIATGSDGWLVEKFLEPHFDGILEDSPGISLDHDSIKGWKISAARNMVNLAMAEVLKSVASGSDQESSKALERMRLDLLGRRVAREDRRGTLYDLVRGENESSLEGDEFKIKYDDGGVEILNAAGLYAALLEFFKEGDDPEYGEPNSDPRMKIRNDSKKAAEALAEALPSVVQDSAKSELTAGKRPAKPSAKHAKRAAPAQEERPQKKPALDSPPKRGRPRGSGQRKKSTTPKKPAATTPKKKTETLKSITPKSVLDSPKSYIGRRVAKMFDDALYFGTVMSYDSGLWVIHYDDNDSEDFDVKEMVKYLKEYALRETEDVNPAAGTTAEESV